MTSPAALQWLEEEFTDLRDAWAVFDSAIPGPLVIKPMIQLRSVMDGGKSMTVTPADYGDPDRRWL